MSTQDFGLIGRGVCIELVLLAGVQLLPPYQPECNGGKLRLGTSLQLLGLWINLKLQDEEAVTGEPLVPGCRPRMLRLAGRSSDVPNFAGRGSAETPSGRSVQGADGLCKGGE